MNQASFNTATPSVRRIRELPLSEQPTYRLQLNGESALSTAELLEVIA